MNKTCKKTERIITLADVGEIVARMPKTAADNAKRQLRKPLLTAYDTHKTNVVYDGKIESAKEHEEMIVWKQRILDLETQAFNNIPNILKYYLG
jgi:hypothetical protein